jgi:putative endonuclease
MGMTKIRGNFGEEVAAKHLKSRGYKILDRNYHTRFGEIDIIAKHGEYYVFAEVKLRRDDRYGGGAGAITPAKQSKIIKTAQIYLAENGLSDSPVRFDVVLVYAGETRFGLKKEKIEVIADAFRL